MLTRQASSAHCSPTWGAKFSSLIASLNTTFSIAAFNSKDTVNAVFSTFIEKYKLALESRITDPSASKHIFYRALASHFGPQSYLLNASAISTRDRICRARLGMLPLDNEIQRWRGAYLGQIARHARLLCLFSNSHLAIGTSECEDEAHFMLRCPSLYSIRQEFRPLLDSLPPPGSISDLLSLQHSDFVTTGNYLTRLWQYRRSLLLSLSLTP